MFIKAFLYVTCSYTKMVVKSMTRAEMILKVVMDASDTNAKYLSQYSRLLPDSDSSEFQKILDMKGVRRTDQQQLIDLYRAQLASQKDGNEASTSSVVPSVTAHGGLPTSPDHESSRIKKLEKLIKRRL